MQLVYVLIVVVLLIFVRRFRHWVKGHKISSFWLLWVGYDVTATLFYRDQVAALSIPFWAFFALIAHGEARRWVWHHKLLTFYLFAVAGGIVWLVITQSMYALMLATLSGMLAFFRSSIRIQQPATP